MLISIHLFANDSFLQESNNIYQYEEQKNIYHDIDTNSKKTQTPYTESATNPITTDIKEGKCFVIQKIIVDPSTIFSDDTIHKLLLPYTNKCLDATKINNAVNTITNAYIELGYITSKGYLPIQDLSKGILLIKILEGKIETFQGVNLNIFPVFTSFENTVLNIRDLEVGLEHYAKQRSKNAVMDLIPGTKEEYTIIKITNDDHELPFFAQLQGNNYGYKPSGEFQLSFSATLEDLLSLNEIWSVGLNSTDKYDSTNRSLGNNISLSFPFNRFYTTLSYSMFKYDKIAKGLNNDYRADGLSETFKLLIDYKLFHTKQQSYSITFFGSTQEYKNYVENVLLDASSNNFFLCGVTLSQQYYATTWHLSNSLTYQRNVNHKTSDYFDDDFDKFTLSSSVTKQFHNKYLPSLSSVLYAQYSDKNSPGTGYISMGGPYSVRGFKEEGISGITGAYLRNDASFAFSNTLFSFHPYLALDFGWVACNQDSSCAHIIGSASGIRIQNSFFNLDTFYSVPLQKPSGEFQTSNFLGINLAITF